MGAPFAAKKAIGQRGLSAGKVGGSGVRHGKMAASKNGPGGPRTGKGPAKQAPAKKTPAKKFGPGPGQGLKQNSKDDTAYNKLWCIDLVVQFGLKECVEDILDDL